MGRTQKFQNIFGVANLSVRRQPQFQLSKIDGTVALVNLHRIASAERNMWVCASCKILEFALLTNLAVGARMIGANL